MVYDAPPPIRIFFPEYPIAVMPQQTPREQFSRFYQHIPGNGRMGNGISPLTIGVRSGIAELLGDLFEDERPPTNAAQDYTLALMRNMARSAPANLTIPIPSVSSRGDGDLSCNWHSRSKRLYLAVFPDGHGSLHLMGADAGNLHEVFTEPDADILINSISWFKNNGPIPRADGQHRPGGDALEGDSQEVARLVT